MERPGYVHVVVEEDEQRSASATVLDLSRIIAQSDEFT